MTQENAPKTPQKGVKSMYNWVEIRKAFVEGCIHDGKLVYPTCALLSRIYGACKGGIANHRNSEGWLLEREQHKKDSQLRATERALTVKTDSYDQIKDLIVKAAVSTLQEIICGEATMDNKTKSLERIQKILRLEYNQASKQEQLNITSSLAIVKTEIIKIEHLDQALQQIEDDATKAKEIVVEVEKI